jgi:hypothetical protein
MTLRGAAGLSYPVAHFYGGRSSALSAWYRERVGDGRGRIKRIAIVALARKLLVALWRFVTQGIVPESAALKAAKAA